MKVEITISISIEAEIEEDEIDNFEESIPYDEFRSMFIESIGNFSYLRFNEPKFTYSIRS